MRRLGAALAPWLIDRMELSRGGSQNALPMEGLRGVAVFLVFLVHYSTLSAPWFADAGPLVMAMTAIHSMGDAGVDLFFVLSGYLIYGTLMKRPKPFTAFLARRARRIYPAFLVMFALYLAASLVAPSFSKLPKDGVALYIAANLLLLPGIFPIEPLITVAWSLSYEALFYVLVPGVIAGARLRAWSVRQRIGGLLAVAAAILSACALVGGPVRLVMFVAGMLIHELRSAAVRAPGPTVALFSACAAILLKVVPMQGSDGTAAKTLALFIGFGLLCWSCLSDPRTWLAMSLSWTPLRWLGNMSYSFYLVHGVALLVGLKIAAVVVPPVWFLGAALLPIMFVLALAPSLMLYLVVERPISLVRGGST